jgi:hypothetical protein
VGRGRAQAPHQQEQGDRPGWRQEAVASLTVVDDARVRLPHDQRAADGASADDERNVDVAELRELLRLLHKPRFPPCEGLRAIPCVADEAHLVLAARPGVAAAPWGR